jgi:uncharacterized membrane protein YadS
MRDLFRTEDWWAVWIGLFVVALSLGVLGGVDLLGWSVNTKEWVDVTKAFAPLVANKHSGIVSLLGSFVFLLTVLSFGAWCIGLNVRRFVASFAVVFGISYVCFLIGHNAYIAATPDKRANFGIEWSLGLTGEAGYIIALLVGLALGNFFPGVANRLREAARPEWYIKAAIVILGASLGLKAVGDTRLTQAIMFRGFAAIIEAYLIYWALVYYMARRWFGFSREWAAPLASGISICGVSAAIATGAAIRARPVVPIMVSSLVVIFAVVELLILPVFAHAILPNEPMVAAAWMGLAVKTDGAAIASGEITKGLYNDPDLAVWMQMTTATVKVFIDVFIGVWAFVLALVWVYGINKKSDEKVPARAIWERFPKFVLGYFLTFAVVLVLALTYRDSSSRLAELTRANASSNIFRQLFFVMTFFTIGLVSDFRKLWREGIGKLAVVYLISLFGFIIWIGLAISWIFFHGVRPA